MDLLIYNYAKKHNIDMEDGETLGTIHSRIVKNVPNLHTRDELKTLASDLMRKLYYEYDKDLKALMVFARNPLIHSKEYHGFEEVYLYQNIHNAMGHTVQAFCEMHKIVDELDKAILQKEFSNVWEEKMGFMHIFDPKGRSTELITLMGIIKRHGFDKDYISFIEDDLKYALLKNNDKYFHKKDLTDRDTIILLYEMVGITYSFDEFTHLNMFHEYDGYGNVLFGNSIVNDFSIYRGE